MVKVKKSFPLLHSFFLSYMYLSFFLSSTFTFFSSFFLSHEVPFPLSTSPASESLCPTTTIVDLSFATLFPFFRTFTFLFETVTTFTQRFNSTHLLVTINHSPFCLLFRSFFNVHCLLILIKLNLIIF